MFEKPHSMIGVLGLGQYGGKIAEKAHIVGMPAVAANLSKRDLDSLYNLRKKFHFAGDEGAGLDRSKGIEAIMAHWDDFMEYLRDKFNEVRHLYVAFSLDGGTGSGTGPIVIDSLLDAFPGTSIGAIVTLPDIDVCAKGQANTLTAFQELQEIEGLGSVIVVDNGKWAQLNTTDTLEDLYISSNTRVINDLIDVCAYTKKISTIRNFDESDLMGLLATPGMLHITTVNMSRKEEAMLTIENGWEQTPYASFVKSTVGAVGAIYCGKPIVTTREIMTAMGFGGRFKTFEGYYDGSNKLTTMLAGLPFPIQRLTEIEQQLDLQQETLRQVAAGNVTKFKPRNNIDFLTNSSKISEMPMQNISDKWAKYKR